MYKRQGYGAGPDELIKAMAILQSQSTSGASSVSQAAALEALSGPQDCVTEFAWVFRERRDLAVAELSGSPGLELSLIHIYFSFSYFKQI